MTVDWLRIGLLVFFAALLQATIFGAVDAGGGRPDVLLVTLVAVALLRGTVAGAVAGFVGGLVIDLATLETLGVTSLLLTLAGYWAGRYGETTGRNRPHAPYLSVLVVTALYALGGYVLHTILGDEVSARVVLLTSLLPALAFNLVLTAPAFALCRRALRSEQRDQAREVRLLG